DGRDEGHIAVVSVDTADQSPGELSCSETVPTHGRREPCPSQAARFGPGRPLGPTPPALLGSGRSSLSLSEWASWLGGLPHLVAKRPRPPHLSPASPRHGWTTPPASAWRSWTR